jgi:DNA-binding MarR family transcriptional regulator
MAEQTDLFSTPPPAPQALARRADPSASHEAARVVAFRLSELQSRVIASMRTLGDMPVSDIADALGERRDTISPRMKQLEKLGYVRRLPDSQKRRPKDPTLTVKQTVWSLNV